MDAARIIADAADEAVASTDDVEAAAEWLMRAANDNREMRRALLAQAVYDAIREATRRIRSTITRAAERSETSNTTRFSNRRVHSLIQATTSAWLNWPLLGGKPLRTATMAEVSRAAEFYRRQGSTMLLNSRWLQLIRGTYSGDTIVGKVMTEAKLQQLRKAAAHG